MNWTKKQAENFLYRAKKYAEAGMEEIMETSAQIQIAFKAGNYDDIDAESLSDASESLRQSLGDIDRMNSLFERDKNGESVFKEYAINYSSEYSRLEVIWKDGSQCDMDCWARDRILKIPGVISAFDSTRELPITIIINQESKDVEILSASILSALEA